jgi:hypothetical protein
MSAKAAKKTKVKPEPTPKDNANKIEEPNAQPKNPNPSPEEALDLNNLSAAEFVHAFEGHIEQLTNILWEGVLKANKEGVFVNRNIAASAFAEVTLRICVAQAKSVEGGVERFKQILDL